MNPIRNPSRIQGVTVISRSGPQSDGTTLLLAGESIIVKNNDRNNVMTQFVVGNNSIAGTSTPTPAYILGMDGVPALPVYPQTVVTLETDSPFRILNPNTTQITIIIGQLLLISVDKSAGGFGAPSGGGGSSGGRSGAGSQSATGTVGGIGGTGRNGIP